MPSMKNQGVKKVINKRAPFVSPGVQGREPRFKPGTFSKAISVALLVLSAFLLIIYLLQRSGYHLIRSEIFYYTLWTAIAGVLVWAVYGARKIVKRPTLKRTMTVSATLLAVLVMFYVTVYISAAVNYANAEAGRSTSPAGENTLVILRSYYLDYERLFAEAREAAPEAEESELQEAIMQRVQTGGDPNIFSYIYMAYPLRAGIFYYTKAEVGPEVLKIAQDSEAELRVRWEDEDSAVLYAANPGPYDKGEFTVKCK